MDPYRIITEWWGEPLSKELADRINSAPNAHITGFFEFVIAQSASPTQLPKLAPGHLRPYVRTSADDVVRNRYSDLALAPQMLLYAHEVVIDNPLQHISGVLGARRDLLRAAIRLLLSIQPLFSRGIVHFASTAAPKPAAADLEAKTSALIDRLVANDASSEVANWIKASALEVRRSEPRFARLVRVEDFVRDLLAADVATTVGFEARHATRLFRSVAELEVYEGIAGLRPMRPERNLAHIATLSVPGFHAGLDDLVRVRLDDDSFARWRSALTTALLGFDQDLAAEGGSAEDRAAASRRLAIELQPLRDELSASLRPSHLLHSARPHAVQFGAGSLGAGASLLAGGSLESSLVAGGVTFAAATAIDAIHLRAKQTRDREKAAALHRLSMAFFSSTP